MLRAYEYVLDNPGCTKSEAAWATFSRYEAWPAVNRAVRAGLIVIDRTRSNRYRITAAKPPPVRPIRIDPSNGDAWRPTPAPELVADGYWHPGHP